MVSSHPRDDGPEIKAINDTGRPIFCLRRGLAGAETPAAFRLALLDSRWARIVTCAGRGLELMVIFCDAEMLLGYANRLSLVSSELLAF
jgi:hypothetical protein